MRSESANARQWSKPLVQPHESFALIALLTVLLCGCQSDTENPERALKPPVLDHSFFEQSDPSFDIEVKEALKLAFEKASAAPGNGELWAELAKTYHAHGFLHQALSAYDYALGLEPGRSRWRYLRALILQSLGRLDEAEADLEEVITRNSDYLPARWRLGLWALERGQLDRAETQFSHVVTMDPEHVGGLLGTARLALARGKPASAESILKPLVQRLPDDRYVHHLLGTAYLQMSRREDARFHLQMGKDASPIVADPWHHSLSEYRKGFQATFTKAHGLWTAGKMSEAIVLLERLVQKYPGRVHALNYLASAYLASGQPEKSIPLLDQVFQHKPNSYKGYVNLAEVHRSQDQWEQASQAVERALAINSEQGDAWRVKARLLQDQQLHEQALEVFERVLKIDSRGGLTQVSRGLSFLHLKRWSEARTCFEKALAEDPSLSEGHLGLAILGLEMGAGRSMEPVIKKALSSAQRDAELFTELRGMLVERLREVRKGQMSK